MKKPVLLSVLGGLAIAAPALHAHEIKGRVISSVPVVQQVAVPREVCSTRPVLVQQPPSGAGAVLGALTGGAAGNAIGAGSGRAAATAIGIVGGALLGNQVEGGSAQVQPLTQCSTQTTYENRTLGYDVTYEYAGQQYTVRLPQDPGPTIALQVVPAESAPPAAPVATAPAAGVPVATVIREVTVPGTVAYPSYPAGYPYYGYYPAPVYRPYYWTPGVSIGIGFGFGGGHHHRWH